MSMYHVEILTGGRVLGGPGAAPPNYHVCDERGRTVRVFTRGQTRRPGHGYRPEWARSAPGMAQDYADALTAAGGRTIQMRTGHSVIVG